MLTVYDVTTALRPYMERRELADFAKKTGINYHVLWRIATGRVTNPRIDTMTVISEALQNSE